MVKNTPLTYIAWITTDHAMFKRTCNRLYQFVPFREIVGPTALRVVGLWRMLYRGLLQDGFQPLGTR